MEKGKYWSIIAFFGIIGLLELNNFRLNISTLLDISVIFEVLKIGSFPELPILPIITIKGNVNAITNSAETLEITSIIQIARLIYLVFFTLSISIASLGTAWGMYRSTSHRYWWLFSTGSLALYTIFFVISAIAIPNKFILFVGVAFGYGIITVTTFYIGNNINNLEGVKFLWQRENVKQ